MSQSLAPQNTPKSNSNQNTLAIILLGLLMLVGALMLFSLQQNKQQHGQSDRLTTLKKNADELERAMHLRGITIPEEEDSISNILQRIRRDSASLEQAITGHQNDLNHDKQTISGLRAQLDASSVANTQLTRELAQLRNTTQQLQLEQGQNATNQQQLVELQAQLSAQQNTIAELSSRPSAELVKQAHEALNHEMLKNDELTKQIVKLTAQLEAGAPVAPAPVEAPPLRPLITGPIAAEIPNPNQQSSATTSAASESLTPSPLDSGNSAENTFIELQKLEGLTEDQLITAYATLWVNHKAKLISEVVFDDESTTSAQPQQLADLKDRLTAIAPNTSILVVSFSGSDKTSSNTPVQVRAQALAQFIEKNNKQKLPVVIKSIGSTKRFSADAKRNAICQIWQVAN